MKTKKLLGNKKGTAEIVGTALFIIILFFFFSNVFLWNNEVTKEMDQIVANKMNSPVEIAIDPFNYELEVKNRGGVDVFLSRLWIINSTQTSIPTHDHLYADFGSLNSTAWVQAGSTKIIKLSGETKLLDDESVNATSDDYGNIIVDYNPQVGQTIIFKIVTEYGNTAADRISVSSP